MPIRFFAFICCYHTNLSWSSDGQMLMIPCNNLIIKNLGFGSFYVTLVESTNCSQMKTFIKHQSTLPAKTRKFYCRFDGNVTYKGLHVTHIGLRITYIGLPCCYFGRAIFLFHNVSLSASGIKWCQKITYVSATWHISATMYFKLKIPYTQDADTAKMEKHVNGRECFYMSGCSIRFQWNSVVLITVCGSQIRHPLNITDLRKQQTHIHCTQNIYRRRQQDYKWQDRKSVV